MFGQSAVHEEYFNHLYVLFKEYCRSPPFSGVVTSTTGKPYSYCRFNTRSLKCFNPLFELFYVAGVKIIPANIQDLLTPSGVAYWLCDDGNLHTNGGMILCTDGFTKVEVELLAKALTDKFGLKVSLRSYHQVYYRLYIWKESMPELRSLVQPYMQSSMLYKLGL
jgi:hypothetical protein